jgi:DNA-binding Lrp family transcriptional regulator
MDEIDEQLLSLLTRNARMPVANLAKSLGLARSTVQSRLERLERDGVIAGYTLRLGQAARGERIRATALLQIEPMTLPAILSRLKALPEVRAAHTASGRFDLIVRISAPTTAALDCALDAIGDVPGVRSSESLIHLSTRIDRRAF